MTKQQLGWIEKAKGLGIPTKATPIDTTPRRFFAMAAQTLKQWDFPGSGAMLTKTLDQAVSAAESYLAKQGGSGTYYVMEIKKVVKAEAIVTTKVEDLSGETEDEKMEDHYVLKAMPSSSQPDIVQPDGPSTSLNNPPSLTDF